MNRVDSARLESLDAHPKRTPTSVFAVAAAITVQYMYAAPKGVWRTSDLILLSLSDPTRSATEYSHLQVTVATTP